MIRSTCLASTVLVVVFAMASGCASCVQTPSGSGPQPSTMNTDKSAYLTRVNPMINTGNTKDMIFEPDYFVDSIPAWGFLVSVRSGTNFNFAVQYDVPTKAGSITNAQVISRVIPGDTPYKQILSGQLQQAAPILKKNQVAFWVQSIQQNVDANGSVDYLIGIFVPDSILPQFTVNNGASITGRVRVSGQGSSPAEFQVTKGVVKDILAIGDSIVWGEGLQEPQKFTSLVAERLFSQMGIISRVYKYPHSGAQLLSSSTCPSIDVNSTFPGELPNTPGKQQFDHVIPCQLQAHLSRDGIPPPDLIIVNGCANDVGIPDNLVPWLFKGADPTNNLTDETIKLGQRIENMCHGGMKPLLQNLVSQFDTKVIVVGYFAPLSDNSLNFLNQQLQPSSSFFDLATAASNTLRASFNFVVGAETAGLQHRSDWWWNHSNSALNEAIRDVNGAATNPQIGFAKIDFPPGHRMFESGTFVFDILSSRDDMIALRGPECDQFDPSDPTCQTGEFFHPNVQGEQVYADSVMQTINTLGVFTPNPDGSDALKQKALFGSSAPFNTSVASRCIDYERLPYQFTSPDMASKNDFGKCVLYKYDLPIGSHLIATVDCQALPGPTDKEPLLGPCGTDFCSWVHTCSTSAADGCSTTNGAPMGQCQ